MSQNGQLLLQLSSMTKHIEQLEQIVRTADAAASKPVCTTVSAQILILKRKQAHLMYSQFPIMLTDESSSGP